MNKILIGLFAALLLFAGCGDDDTTEPASRLEVSGTVSFGDESYELSEGLIQDFGTADGFTNFDFYLADGQIAFNTLGVVDNIDANTLLIVELFQQADQFSGGSFLFSASDSPPFSYFNQVILGDVRPNGGVLAEAVGGTITVTQMGTGWEITLDVETVTETKLTGLITIR